MSDSMLSLYESELERGIDDSEPFATLPTREQQLQQVVSRGSFDLVILGGGLLGVMVAHEAALQGVSTLLIERAGFGVDAVSWDVRISRALRLSPISLLREPSAIKLLSKARAPHLVSDLAGDGNALPGLLARLARRWLPLANVDERLLIRESVLAARQEGALVLSGVTPTFVEAEGESGCYAVGFRDEATQQNYQARVGGIVIDPTHGVLPPARLGTKVLNVPEPRIGGARVIYHGVPQSAKRGFPFTSFELSNGASLAIASRALGLLEVTVLFGERELDASTIDAIARQACEEAGWSVGDLLSQCSVAGHFGASYAINQSRGVFTCHHRGVWDAARSAKVIVESLLKLAPEPRPLKRLSPRLLPGGEIGCESDSFRALARSHGVAEKTIELCVQRWRGRVRYLPHFINGLREVCPGVLRAELDLAMRADQVVSFDDLLHGSLNITAMADWQSYLPALRNRYDDLVAEPFINSVAK